jgi:Animal haem peroxidase
MRVSAGHEQAKAGTTARAPDSPDESIKEAAVEKHGSESYFVIGEGLLAEANEGRANGATIATASARDTSPPFRFSRMGPKGVNKQLGEGIRKKVGHEMAAGGGGAQGVPAGFTYLGQFVDHDLTFDKTTVTLGSFISPAMLLQARSPSLDLDSLYGAGPQDPESAKFYETDGLHLKMGETVPVDGIPKKKGFDLPRGEGSSQAQKRKAVIPDLRNDENLAVAQTHLAMIRFHNRVVDTQLGGVPASQKFAKAREIVTKHYQWMLKTDYLTRIAAKGVVTNVFNQGRKVFEVTAAPTDVPTMPIEFSIASFRLGHAMIRSAYNWNKIFDDGFGSLDLLFTFSATSGNLGGDPRLPSNWIADFRRLYDFRENNKPALTVPEGKFNRAMRIDTTLVNPLEHLPTGSFGGPNVGFDDPRRNLAFRNLTRARMVRLATGQQMANFMKNKGVTVTKLTAAQIRNGKNGADIESLTKSQREAFVKNTPLWFYILREAEFNGGKLKGVGARIVAETFHRAMEGSTHSIVRDPAFKPTLGPNNKTFRMVDLLFFAFDGKKNLLAPLG